MDKKLAKRISEIMQDITGQLDISIRLVMDNTDNAQDFQKYRRLVGKLMGEIFAEILQPIYDQYPDLTPAGLRKEDTLANKDKN